MKRLRVYIEKQYQYHDDNAYAYNHEYIEQFQLRKILHGGSGQKPNHKQLPGEDDVELIEVGCAIVEYEFECRVSEK
jgi:hypothetical protein